MVFPLSFKVLMVTALFIAVLIQVAYAQDIRGEDYVPNCPNEIKVHYKDCRGSLDQCSNCLETAENKCREAQRKKVQSEDICDDCTSALNGGCDSIKEMCFGNQECASMKGNSNYKCFDYECVYQPS